MMMMTITINVINLEWQDIVLESQEIMKTEIREKHGQK